ncbi:MAG: hypothetical protein E4G98_05795 [Promethearchaeota archaeon]|nr:MAG: hypothetical protein E4G98_05795 [Candidatus Lokiarchaeota archaeon]
MVRYNLKKYGSVEINKKKVKCEFTVSPQEFFNDFRNVQLSARAKETVSDAIMSRSEEKTKDQEELETYFGRIQENLKSDTTPPKSTTKEEKSTGSASADTAKGEKLPIVVQEKIVAKYAYNFLSDEKSAKEESAEVDENAEGGEGEEESQELEEGYGILTRDGQITFKNVAKERVWDLEGKITHNGNIEELDSEFYIKELNGEEEASLEYKIKADKEPSLKLTETISTINNPKITTYSLNMGAENVVYFKLRLTNTEEFPIKNIKVTKSLFEGYENFKILSTSIGKGNSEENNLLWEIEKLDTNGEATLEFTLGVTLSNKEDTVRSGVVEIVYDSDFSLSDLNVEEFSAIGDNMVSTTDEQLDDKPDFYRGFLEYENLSPYIAKLKQVSVKELEKDKELITLSDDEVFISAGTEWQSNTWEIDTQSEIPRYQKTVEFILLHEISSTTSTSVEIEDIELAVAIFDASVMYDIDVIDSHRVVPFNSTHTLTNGGATPFDYLSIEQVIPDRFKLPEKDEIALTVDGKKYKLDQDWVSIENRKIVIKMDGLKDSKMGMFEPNQEMVVIYPIVAENLTPADEFISNVEWRANTLPRGEPIIIREEEPVKIAVVHRRIKIYRGKTIMATGDENVFEVTLKVRNNGNFAVSNYEFQDRIPKNFKAEDLSMEPTSEDKHDGKKVLVWTIENLDVNADITVKYLLRPTGEKASASEAQFSM